MTKQAIDLLESLPDDPEDSIRIRIKSSGEEKMLMGVFPIGRSLDVNEIELAADGKINVTFQYDWTTVTPSPIKLAMDYFAREYSLIPMMPDAIMLQAAIDNMRTKARELFSASVADGAWLEFSHNKAWNTDTQAPPHKDFNYQAVLILRAIHLGIAQLSLSGNGLVVNKRYSPNGIVIEIAWYDATGRMLSVDDEARLRQIFTLFLSNAYPHSV
jgi:hypothetical protein